jgi:hypothetical protein
MFTLESVMMAPARTKHSPATAPALDEQCCRHGVSALDVGHQAGHVVISLTLTQRRPGRRSSSSSSSEIVKLLQLH